MSDNVLLYAPQVVASASFDEIPVVVPTAISATSPNNRFALGSYTFATTGSSPTTPNIPEVQIAINYTGTIAMSIWHRASEKNSVAHYATKLYLNDEEIFSIGSSNVTGPTSSPYYQEKTSSMFYINVTQGDILTYKHIGGESSNTYAAIGKSPKWGDSQIWWWRGNSGNGAYSFGINVGYSVATITDSLLTVSNAEIDINSLITILE